MGFRTVAINRGRDKEELARRLGADGYIDSTECDAGEALKALGGASAVLATVSHAELQTDLIKGLRPNGQLIVLEGRDSIQVTGHDLANDRLTLSGWYSGVAQDSEDTLNFAVFKGVRPIIETYPSGASRRSLATPAEGQPPHRPEDAAGVLTCLPVVVQGSWTATGGESHPRPRDS